MSGSALATQHASLARAVAEHRDRSAFAQLFDYYGPRLNAYLLRLGAERAAAEEMTQDVMLILWRKAELFDPQKSSLGTWLYRVARNRRIDVARRGRIEAYEIDESTLQVADDAPGADNIMDSNDRQAALRQAMATLPPDQRDLVQLSFFEALSHSEIVTRTGLPLGTVKSRIRLAFTRLRRALESNGIDEA